MHTLLIHTVEYKTVRSMKGGVGLYAVNGPKKASNTTKDPKHNDKNTRREDIMLDTHGCMLKRRMIELEDIGSGPPVSQFDTCTYLGAKR